MVLGYTRLKAFLRRSAGLDIDKSDAERLTELIGRKLNDLLVIGVRNASYNHRDIVMEPDLPLTKGCSNTCRSSAAIRRRSTCSRSWTTWPPTRRWSVP